jgi:hypothetical protein
MAEKSTGYKHDASDRKLDESAEMAKESDPTNDTQQSAGPRHDPAKIRQHDDVGKDRLFEDRQQHDDAEKNSEKTRLAKDVARHDHVVDDDVADSGSRASAKRKS